MKICITLIILLISFGNLFSIKEHSIKFKTPVRVTKHSDADTKLIYEDGANLLNGQLICYTDTSNYTYQIQAVYKFEKQRNLGLVGALVGLSASYAYYWVVTHIEHSGEFFVPEIVDKTLIPGLITAIIGYNIKYWSEYDLEAYKLKYDIPKVSVSLLPVYNPIINFTGLNLSVSF